MLKTIHAAMLVTIAACTAAAPALAYPSSWSFTHEPTGYRVSVRDSGGTMYLRGRHSELGKTFKMRVSSSGHVTGEFEGRTVDYVIGKRAETPALLAGK